MKLLRKLFLTSLSNPDLLIRTQPPSAWQVLQSSIPWHSSHGQSCFQALPAVSPSSSFQYFTLLVPPSKQPECPQVEKPALIKHSSLLAFKGPIYGSTLTWKQMEFGLIITLQLWFKNMNPFDAAVLSWSLWVTEAHGRTLNVYWQILFKVLFSRCTC